ncbi:hypothetical protein K7G98_24075, partial [Saccharothrix sp. MB29]|nr:hypothetical protein [Saccharothrix sp. MB29]
MNSSASVRSATTPPGEATRANSPAACAGSTTKSGADPLTTARWSRTRSRAVTGNPSDVSTPITSAWSATAGTVPVNAPCRTPRRSTAVHGEGQRRGGQRVLLPERRRHRLGPRRAAAGAQ